MSKKIERSFSPLRKLRETGRLYLPGQVTPYMGNKEDLESAKELYENQIKKRLYEMNPAEKELLEMYVSRLSKLKDGEGEHKFKKLTFYNDGDQIGQNGEYSKNENKGELKLNLLSQLNQSNAPGVGLGNILNHELTHASNHLDTPSEQEIRKFFRDKRGLATLQHRDKKKSDAVYKFPLPDQYDSDESDAEEGQAYYNDMKNIDNDARNRKLNIQEKNNLYDSSLAKIKKLILDIQNTLDPSGFFATNYPEHGLPLYPKIDDLYAKNKWSPDEFNAFTMQNLVNLQNNSNDPEVVNFISELLKRNQKKFQDNYKLSKYPNLRQTLRNKIGEFNAPKILSNQKSLGQGLSQIGENDPDLETPDEDTLNYSSRYSKQGKQSIFQGNVNDYPYIEQDLSQSAVLPISPKTQKILNTIEERSRNIDQKKQQWQSDRPQSRGPIIGHRDEYGNVVYKPEERKSYATGGSVSSNYDPYLNTGSASSGLGSLYDYINYRYARGGGVGLGSMGRFFGIYPSDY